MDRLVIDDRKATVTQPLVTTKVFRIPSLNRCSRRPHRVPLLSANNWKRRLQFAHAHQNWTIEDWKNVAWSDESRFLLRHSDGRVRIWCKEHESIDPSCLVSTVQAGGGGGVMCVGYFLSHPKGASILVFVEAI